VETFGHMPDHEGWTDRHKCQLILQSMTKR